MPAHQPDVRDLLCRAVDEWAAHCRSCALEDCRDCEVLFHGVMLAHAVYGSSQRGPRLTCEVAMRLRVASARAHERAREYPALQAGHTGGWYECAHDDCVHDRALVAALDQLPAPTTRRRTLAPLDIGDRAMEGL